MRKLLFLLFISTLVKAQNSVNVSLIMPSPYSQYFNDYTQFVGQNVLTLTNTTNNTNTTKITTITKCNAAIATIATIAKDAN